MSQLYYELGVLAKAVQHKNLSAAAIHVGLSQPQLSRIIARIENDLKIILLDRSIKRKSGWTATAIQLAELFEKANSRLAHEVQNLSQTGFTHELRIGTLEGLTHFAMKLSKNCFDNAHVEKISLDVFDLNELEAHFTSGDLDLILTSKLPGRQKHSHVLELGFQRLDKVQTSQKYGVYSTFEYGRLHKQKVDQFEHLFISNSLALRKEWLTNWGGTGLLPSEAKKGRSKEHEPIYLIATEILSPILWQSVSAIFEEK